MGKKIWFYLLLLLQCLIASSFESLGKSLEKEWLQRLGALGVALVVACFGLDMFIAPSRSLVCYLVQALGRALGRREPRGPSKFLIRLMGLLFFLGGVIGTWASVWTILGLPNLPTGWEMSGGAFPISISPSTRRGRPAIYGDIAVWADERNGNWDIYGYNLSDDKELALIVDSADQERPAIYGHVMVWMDDRSGNWDIYGQNLLTKELIPICTNSCAQLNPDIYENFVVWMDNRNGNFDIYAYDLDNREEFRLTNDPSDQTWPAVYGDLVVWQDMRNGDSDIYGYDLETKTDFPIVTGSGEQYAPDVYDDRVAWTETASDGSQENYVKSLVEGDEILVSTQGGEATLYAELMIWASGSQLYGYDLSIQQLLKITTEGGPNAVYERTVVWVTGGKWSKIYGIHLPG